MSSLPPIAWSAKARRTQEQPISYLIAVAKATPNLISFAAGLVDPMTLPYEEVAAISHRILSDPERARDALQYSTTIGPRRLRETIVKHLERLEGVPAGAMSITPDNVILTTGSQQALYMLADVLLDPNDIVIIEAPSYFVYAGALASFGAKILSVPMDRDGMVVEELDKLLSRLESHGELHRVKAVYCQSYFQNPTGLTLSLERRRRLVDIVTRHSKQHRILIIEDSAYRELRYDGDEMPSIKRFDPDNQFVATCYTFDKPFAAGLKVGYAVLPTQVLNQVLEQKGNHDFGSSHLCQQIVCEAMNDGSYQEHLAVMHAGYIAKRNRMLAALDHHLGGIEGVQWTRAAGGLYVWLSLPLQFDTSRRGGMFDDCLGRGVIYVPGEYCFHPDESGHVPQNHMRLCYAVTPIEQIEPGMDRLAGAIKARLK
jgi:2-aminoadipate transaminase